MTSLHSPMDLCERLGLRPDPKQLEILHRFYEQGEPVMRVTDAHSWNTSRVTAICALWHLMRFEGTEVVVVASEKELADRFMDFLQDLTTSVDPAIASICRWTRRRVLTVDGTSGSRLRFMSNRPQFAQGIRNETLLTVILGAGSSDPAFVETTDALKIARAWNDGRSIEVW